jgi:hypothetical protein
MPYIIVKSPDGEFDENIQIYSIGSTLGDWVRRLLLGFDAVSSVVGCSET